MKSIIESISESITESIIGRRGSETGQKYYIILPMYKDCLILATHYPNQRYFDTAGMSWFLLDQNQLVERCNQGFPHDISTVVFDIPNNKIIQFKSDIGKTKYKLAYLEMIPADTSKKLKEYIENSK